MFLQKTNYELRIFNEMLTNKASLGCFIFFFLFSFIKTITFIGSKNRASTEIWDTCLKNIHSYTKKLLVHNRRVILKTKLSKLGN